MRFTMLRIAGAATITTGSMVAQDSAQAYNKSLAKWAMDAMGWLLRAIAVATKQVSPD